MPKIYENYSNHNQNCKISCVCAIFVVLRGHQHRSLLLTIPPRKYIRETQPMCKIARFYKKVGSSLSSYFHPRYYEQAPIAR